MQELKKKNIWTKHTYTHITHTIMMISLARIEKRHRDKNHNIKIGYRTGLLMVTGNALFPSILAMTTAWTEKNQLRTFHTYIHKMSWTKTVNHIKSRPESAFSYIA